MGALDGRVAVITGAGRGMGREHALLFAAEGAKVVVNDTGGAADGTGHEPAVAAAVVEEIRAAGGDAVASDHDVATLDGAHAAISAALDTWGRLDVVVNNAGILRDRMFVNMTEDEWDAVIRGHLRSHFCVTRTAAGHWRDRSKAGEENAAAVVNVSSTSGLRGAVGQSNYGAAKAGIAALTVILAEELARYGVRGERDRPGGADPDDRGCGWHRRHGPGARGPGRVRRVPPRERVADGRMAGDGVLSGHGSGVPGPGRGGSSLRRVARQTTRCSKTSDGPSATWAPPSRSSGERRFSAGGRCNGRYCNAFQFGARMRR